MEGHDFSPRFFIIIIINMNEAKNLVFNLLWNVKPKTKLLQKMTNEKLREMAVVVSLQCNVELTLIMLVCSEWNYLFTKVLKNKS